MRLALVPVVVLGGSACFADPSFLPGEGTGEMDDSAGEEAASDGDGDSRADTGGSSSSGDGGGSSSSGGGSSGGSESSDGTGTGSRCEGADQPVAEVQGCMASSPDVRDCANSYDSQESDGPPYLDSTLRGDCSPGGGSSHCTYGPQCSPSGCIDNLWIRYDLGGAETITMLRFRAGWRTRRPLNYEVWASDDPDATPGDGANIVANGVGHLDPWECVEGESCDDSAVPTQCCPGGTDQPQNLAEISIRHWSKWDELALQPTEARYWYLLVIDSYEPSEVSFHEVEWVRACP